MTDPQTTATTFMSTVNIAVLLIALLSVGGLAFAILWAVFTHRIDLKYLISDGEGSASMSRFQLLIFTFVVASSILYFVSRPDATGFPEIPGSVLTLLGISGTSFLVGKSLDSPGASSADPKPSEGDGDPK